ncbi:NADP-dependent oxidoreductase [Streptosporangium sp. 'caverna']|uniref:NADP-dependent oxidoreductase n=1 Tax=Streptosporangium sp. 'caverna' TaxID=2202249 RepID=UPI001EF97A00|nr:NADP-dependent oxidoreductase [Streptosporangium sp. 'caverna']
MTMRAVVIRSVGSPEVVKIAEFPRPEPGAGQIRIKVEAAALNPADAGLWSGAFGPIPDGQYLGLGWDVAGTVDAVGPITDLTVGDRVIAIIHGGGKPLGGQAEYVVVEQYAAAPAPARFDSAAASTLPLNALTAVQALDNLGLRSGDTLAVTGAAGAVGGYALEIARTRGIRTLALARPSDEEYVTGTLGARWFTTSGDDPAAAIRGIWPDGADGVLDAAVLGDAVTGAVRDGGSYTGVRGDRIPRPTRGIKISLTSVAPDGAGLTKLVHLADAGLLTPRVAQTYPLADAAKAHAHMVQGGLRGRVVLIP